jgi:Trk K+ transport system NAD-binding subunit
MSALAAPAFAAALLGAPREQPLALPGVPLRTLEATLTLTSALANTTVAEAEARNDLRVLAIDGRWSPKPDATLAPDTRIAIVGTREACDAVLERGQST